MRKPSAGSSWQQQCSLRRDRRDGVVCLPGARMDGRAGPGDQPRHRGADRHEPEAALANRQVQIDVATFIHWVDARAERRSPLASFYRTRFRKEFEPPFLGWLATKPFTNSAAP